MRKITTPSASRSQNKSLAAVPLTRHEFHGDCELYPCTPKRSSNWLPGL